MRRYIILAGFILMGIKPAFSQAIFAGFTAIKLYNHEEKIPPFTSKGIDISYIHYFEKMNVGIGYTFIGEDAYKLSFGNNLQDFVCGISVVYYNRGLYGNFLPKKFGGEMNLSYEVKLKDMFLVPKFNLGFNTEDVYFSIGVNAAYKFIK